MSKQHPMLAAKSTTDVIEPKPPEMSQPTWRPLTRSRDAPIRTIITSDTRLLGAIPTGNKVVVMHSIDQGTTWERIGCVVSCNDGSKTYGDATLLLVGGTLLCAFRVESTGQHFKWQVVVCKSTDTGRSWVFDSVVDTTPAADGLFVGAPCLLARGSMLQVYYDKEYAIGDAKMQWVTIRERGPADTKWGPPRYCLDDTTIASIERGAPVGLLRDGMAQVITTADGNIFAVIETVDEAPPHCNLVRGIRSLDGGRHWLPRFEIARGKAAPGGSYFNAYNPYAILVGGGPAFVVFCTDEDYSSPPDKASTRVSERRAAVKLTRSLSKYEDWSPSELVLADGERAKCYNPGLVELPNGGGVICTVDMLDGSRQMLIKGGPSARPV